MRVYIFVCLLTAKLFNVLTCLFLHNNTAMCLFFRAFCRTTTQPCAYFFSLSENLFTYQAMRSKDALDAHFRGAHANEGHCFEAII